VGRIRVGPVNEGHLAKVFMDTGSNFNTISREFYEILVVQGLQYAFYPGSIKGIGINLISGQILNVTVNEFLSRPKLERVWSISILTKI
jgi:hypothetical protein